MGVNKNLYLSYMIKIEDDGEGIEVKKDIHTYIIANTIIDL